MCQFVLSWIGKCEATPEPYCAKHVDMKCVSCGAQATHDCEETGQFVCGAPLCDNCEHTIHEDGTNGGVGFNQQKPPEGMGYHCKKTEQKFISWFDREDYERSEAS